MNTTAILTDADQAIGDVIQAWSRAISAKDAAGVTACESRDLTVFSLAPPLLETAGAAGLDDWFATWDGPIGHDIRDLQVSVGGDVAFAHGFVHLTGRKIGQPAESLAAGLWFRLTLGLSRQGGAWKIAHVHESVPFYMDCSFRAAVDLQP